MPPASVDPRRILAGLVAHDVRFVVVGGVAAVLQGAPLATFDLDVVHDRSADNVQRLLGALDDLGARSRLHLQAIVRPDASHLVGPGHVLLTTDGGDLDLLGTAGRGRGYDDLVGHSTPMEVGPGLVVQVLDLPTLIELKEEAGRAKDLAALPTLRATLEERRRREE
jgi:hypothetical protein